MIINLTGDRRIITDTYGYNLQKLVISKGDPVWTSYKYYMTLQGLCKGVSEQLLRETDAIGLPEIITALKGLEKVIGQAVEGQYRYVLGVDWCDSVSNLVEGVEVDLDDPLEQALDNLDEDE